MVKYKPEHMHIAHDSRPEEQRAKYDDIISKNSADIGKTMLVEMEIDTGNHPPPAPPSHQNHTHFTKTLDGSREK